ncbi:MFS transporter [Nocardiopsis salina]|uniref:MFS transporter n=1 Tax=Nocardiopsis salina TaxID=245836 RepID=UPI00034725BF|nr:MFS transporter [Nocardiopsis salina]
MSTASTTDVPLRVRRKAVFAASLGNFIEWFEFTLYGFFAAIIALNFFTFDGGESSLVATFAAFGVSFVFRPLGAIVFAHFGDRTGRRTTLSVAVISMSLATFAIGVTPSYETAGVLAPVLLVLARLVQGFSAGGEFGGATSYMVEYAPRGRRAFYGSWQFFTQLLAGLCAACTGAGLSAVLTEVDLVEWGWRIPFVLTLPLGLIGLYLRLKLDETPEFTERRRTPQPKAVGSAPILVALGDHWRILASIIGLMITGTTMFYMMQAFWPAFLVEEVGMRLADMYGAMIVGICANLALIPLWAVLSDRIGRRKPFLVATPVLLLIVAAPVYWLLLQGEFATAVMGYLLVALAGSPMMGVLATAMADSFPTAVRYSGLSLAYSLAVSIFGGFTPLVLSAMVEGTGNLMSPAYYLMATAVVSTVAAALFGEPALGPEPASEPDRVPAD